jgi:hypothetical protein
MQTLGMAKTREGFAGVSVAPVGIGAVEGCECVQMFQISLSYSSSVAKSNHYASQQWKQKRCLSGLSRSSPSLSDIIAKRSDHIWASKVLLDPHVR